MATQNLLFIQTDIKTLTILLLLGILLGTFITIRNYRGGGGTVVEDRSSGSIIPFILLSLIVFVFLYIYFEDSTPAMGPAQVQEQPVIPRQSQQIEEWKFQVDDEVDHQSLFSEVKFQNNTLKGQVIKGCTVDPGRINVVAIQIAAVSTIRSANKILEELGYHSTKVIREDDLFKVLIVGFDNRSKAESYKNQHGLKGFLRGYESLQEPYTVPREIQIPL